METINHNSRVEYRTVGKAASASLLVVLPKRFAVSLGIAGGDFVKVRKEEGRIVIEKA